MQRDDLDPDFEDPTDRPRFGSLGNRNHDSGRQDNAGLGQERNPQLDLTAGTERGQVSDPDIPPLPASVPPLAVEREPDEDAAALASPRLWPILFASGAIAIVSAVGLWVYGNWSGTELAGEVPLLLAEEGAEKVRPAEEGGMEVPNQDVLIYDEIGGEAQPAGPETLMPEPETPLALPAPSVSEPGTGENATVAETVDSASMPALESQPIEDDVDIPSVAAPDLDAEPAAGADQVDAAPQSLESASENQAPTQTAAVTGAYRIQLAAVKSETAAKAAWVKLSKRHFEQLSGMSLRVEKVDRGADGVLYRVQAGPVADRAAAQDLCAQLKSKDQPCLVVAP
jgi:cell division septation protein DedD